MAKFFQWVSKRPAPDAAFAFGAPPEIATHLETIWAGQSLVRGPNTISIEIKPPFAGSLGDDFTVLDHHCLLLSDRLVDALRGAGVDSFETRRCFINANEENKTPSLYSVMILRDVVYCLDSNASELELDVENPRNIEHIESLAIDTVRAQGNLLFRLGEQRQIVLVHESVADVVGEGGFTGVEFEPVDGTVPLPAPVNQVGGEWPDFVLEYCKETAEREAD